MAALDTKPKVSITIQLRARRTLRGKVGLAVMKIGARLASRPVAVSIT